MKTEIGALAAVAATATPLPTPAPSRTPAKGQGPAAPSVRLIIEEDGETGDFIYKTLDRSTGEVILQLPRKEVMKSVATGEYSAGDVFKARA
jgi:flagellar protein FlaG